MNEYNAFYMNEWIYMNVFNEYNTIQCIIYEWIQYNTMHSVNELIQYNAFFMNEWMNEWLQYNAFFMNEWMNDYNTIEWIQYNAFYMNEWIQCILYEWMNIYECMN